MIKGAAISFWFLASPCNSARGTQGGGEESSPGCTVRTCHLYPSSNFSFGHNVCHRARSCNTWWCIDLCQKYVDITKRGVKDIQSISMARISMALIWCSHLIFAYKMTQEVKGHDS